MERISFDVIMRIAFGSDGRSEREQQRDEPTRDRDEGPGRGDLISKERWSAIKRRDDTHQCHR